MRFFKYKSQFGLSAMNLFQSKIYLFVTFINFNVYVTKIEVIKAKKKIFLSTNI